MKRCGHVIDKFCRSFLKDTQGNIAIMTAGVGLPMLLLLGFVVDYSRSGHSEVEVRAALDSAALASVMPTGLSNKAREDLAREVFAQEYTGTAAVTLDAAVTSGRVELTGHGTVETTLGGILNRGTIKFHETSTAVLTKEDVVCVLALDPSGEGAIQFLDESRFTSPACSVQVNSDHKNALVSSISATPTAKSFCVSGASTGEFYPLVKHACTPVADPYAALTAPPDGECIDLEKLNSERLTQYVQTDLYDDAGYSLSRAAVSESAETTSVDSDIVQDDAVLYPGTYCKGLRIEGINIRFMPGTYIITDKELLFKKDAHARGDDVTFILKGDKANLKIESGSTLSLSAPNLGTYKGLVFFEGDDVDSKSLFKKSKSNMSSEIGASGGLSIIGTAYFRTQELIINSEVGVAANSPATAFIAHRLTFAGKSITNIRVDHESSGIPPIMPRSDAGARLVE